MNANTMHNPNGIRVILGLTLCICLPATAHHILGVPHYAYDEQYPQTPILTYKADINEYQIEMTAFPGKPEPGERTSIHVYIRNTRTGEVHDKNTTLTITRDRILVRDPIVYGPIEAELEESMYKFFPNFDRAGNYTLELGFQAADDHWVIELPMQVGEPRSPWAAVGGGGATLIALLVIARAIRIKRKRAAKSSPAQTTDREVYKGLPSTYSEAEETAVESP